MLLNLKHSKRYQTLVCKTSYVSELIGTGINRGRGGGRGLSCLQIPSGSGPVYISRQNRVGSVLSQLSRSLLLTQSIHTIQRYSAISATSIETSTKPDLSQAARTPYCYTHEYHSALE